MNVLIVDDEANIQKTISIALKTLGHNPISAYNGRQTLIKLSEERIDVLLLDLRLESECGLDLFDRIRQEGYEVPVIIFTGHSSIETAVEATRKGVFDYVLKPFVPEQIRQALAKLEKSQQLRTRVEELERQVKEAQPGITFESRDPAMMETYELADRAAKSHANILILGQSGTGKTVLARWIHYRSERARDPFVVVHCPSLSKELLESELFGHVKGSFTGAVKDTWGKIEAADGGTLFLDEIGDLPFNIQSKLLRFLQERRYERIGETKTRQADVRVIAATNKNLMHEVSVGNFREDLFYRINVISLSLPALKNRSSDIETLARSYIDFHVKKKGRGPAELSEAALAALLNYSWPGNLRELNNTMERCIILATGGIIDVDDLPDDIADAAREDSASNASQLPRVGGDYRLEELEEAHIRGVLSRAKSMERAATILGINPTTLYRKRKKMRLVQQQELTSEVKRSPGMPDRRHREELIY